VKSTNIYTDGACSDNQSGAGLGGWGAVLEYGDHRKEIWGAEPGTTNNRMEMMALIGALECLTKEGLRINVFSDSSYLMECFRKGWYVKWRSNGWLTAKKTPVENRDLWEKLIGLVGKHEVSFYRVKGHVSLGGGTKGEPAGSGPNASHSKDGVEQGDATLRRFYAKFKAWNGDEFSFDDFVHATGMNNLADELANRGIDSLRGGGDMK
jgi:ribonuclease HI